jgi:hypothetical protein
MKPKRTYDDFADLKADPEGLGPLPPPTPRKQHKKLEDGFIILTPRWWDIVGRSKLRATPFVAAFLLREGRMHNWQPVKVSNLAVQRWNVDRQAKAAALHELERLGLIKVWHGGGKRTPVVIFLVRG